MVREVSALKRRVGLPLASLFGVHLIVGAGIYAIIGDATGLAGGMVWASFLLAACVASLTGISFIRMGRRVTKDSPEFSYTLAGIGFRAGFLAGWWVVWGDLVALATLALGFGSYFYSLTGVPVAISALVAVSIVSVVSLIGIRESILFAVLLGILEFAGLALVVALGLPHFGEHPLTEAPGGIDGVLSAVALVYFAYIGFNMLGNLSEEMKNPSRDLPKALGIAIAVSTVVYLLVSVSAISLAGWQTIAASPAPLADAVKDVLGSHGKVALSLIAMASILGTALLLTVATSRSLYGMARAGALPNVLARIGVRNTPSVSTLTIWGIVSLFAIAGDLGFAARIANLMYLASFSLVNLSLTVILFKEVGNQWSLRRLLEFLQPVLGLGTCIWLITKMSMLQIAILLLLALAGIILGGRMKPRPEK